MQPCRPVQILLPQQMAEQAPPWPCLPSHAACSTRQAHTQLRTACRRRRRRRRRALQTLAHERSQALLPRKLGCFQRSHESRVRDVGHGPWAWSLSEQRPGPVFQGNVCLAYTLPLKASKGRRANAKVQMAQKSFRS